MAVPADDAGWVNDLSLRHDAELGWLRSLNDEYEGRSARMYMHPEVLREVGDRLTQVVIAWPLLVVGALEERLDVEGFGLPDEDSGDDEMWRVWQANDCDEESQMAHVDALSMQRAYICVGTNEDDESTPLVTYESPLEVFAHIDPRTRKVAAALRRWSDYQTDSLVRTPERYATLYLPNRTVHYEMTSGSLVETGRDEHGLGVVPVVPLLNQGRLAARCGKSELEPVLPLSWAANKLATDMMVAAEFVAIPLRGFLGVGPDSFEDASGNKLTALQAILGRMLMIPEGSDAVKQFEFASAQLGNFHDSVKLLASLVASIAGMDPNDLGVHTDSPASAEAIAGRKERLVKRAERRQRAFGGGHERSMRLVRRLQSGDWDPKLSRLETQWRDASTPTVAAKADATVKLLAAGAITLRQARKDLGYTDAQIARMEHDDDEAAAKNPALLIAGKLGGQDAPVAAKPKPVPAVAGAVA